MYQLRLHPKRALDLIGNKTYLCQHQPGVFVSVMQLSSPDGWVDVQNPVTVLKFKGATGFAITFLLPFGNFSLTAMGCRAILLSYAGR